MDQKKIHELEKMIDNDYHNIGSVIVEKNGIRCYENYFLEYTANSAFHLFSVTKSILSALIGIAVEKGYIESLDQKVLEFFPDYTPKRGEKTAQQVTIKDMLTMTAPFKYKSAPYTKYFSSDSWVKSALDLLGGKSEMGSFRYTPLIGPDILSGILTAATGQSVLEFARKNLFYPMEIDITQKIVFQSKEEQLSIMKNHNQSGWVADPQGINTAGWGLFMTAGDMAKIGRLYLNRGVWNDRRLVPARWIDESTAIHSRWDALGLSYGYLWWVIDGNEHSYAAIGDGGNVIYVNPAKNLVVVIASLFLPRVKDRIELIRDHIEPLFDAE